MSLEKIGHYSLTNPASVYDEEALTALELAGRTAAKVNEAVGAFNTLEKETGDHLQKQDDEITERLGTQDNRITKMNDVTMPAKVTSEVQKQIDNGTFDNAIDEYAGGLENRLNNLIGTIPEGATSMDAEIIDMRVDENGIQYQNAGVSMRYQISVEKRRNDLLKEKTGMKVYYFAELPVEMENKYLDNAGTINNGEGWSIRKLTFEDGAYYVNFMEHDDELVNGWLYNEDGTQAFQIQNNLLNVMVKGGQYVLINDAPTHYKGVEFAVVYYYNYPSPEGYVNECSETRLLAMNMYDAPEATEKTLNACALYKVPIEKGYDYFTNNPTIGGYGNYYTVNDEWIANISANSETKKLNVPDNAAYMKFNSYMFNTKHPVMVYKMPTTEEKTKDVLYPHSVKKPVVFEGKKLVAFGDSITYGATPGLETSKVTPYPEIFAGWNNMTLTNNAVSGTFICSEESNRSITEKIFSYTGGDDIIFIAGGTNDYNFGKPLGKFGNATTETFYGCLLKICAHLKNVAPNAEVYFITPPNQSCTPTGPATNSLNDYRRAIFEIATVYEMNVVDGSQLGFPTIDGSSAFKNGMITDGVHPTAAGHQMYARTLAGIIG